MAVKKVVTNVRDPWNISAEALSTEKLRFIVEDEKRRFVFYLDTHDLACIARESWRVFRSQREWVERNLRFMEKALRGDEQA